MNIAIVGGSGTLGSLVTKELKDRGHALRVLSRSSETHPVDLANGRGLPDATAGCDVVVDASNDSTKNARNTLVNGTRRLLAAEVDAGVKHHVCISVVGCERVPFSYYRVKTEQEDVVAQAPVAWTIVRATQFHEFVAKFLGGMRGLLPIPRARLQTVACSEVARFVADIAEGKPLGRRVEIAGPSMEDLKTLAQLWKCSTGSKALLLPLPLFGQLGKALKAGALTADNPDAQGTISFAGWLQRQSQDSLASTGLRNAPSDTICDT